MMHRALPASVAAHVRCTSTTRRSNVRSAMQAPLRQLASASDGPSKTNGLVNNLMSTTLETKDGKTMAAASALQCKTVVLYFAAQWCPDCAAFTPLLTKAYTEAKAAGKAVEVVFVSSDVDRAAQVAHMNASHGDWLRVPFESALREDLKRRYGTFSGREVKNFPAIKRREGIPNLVVVGPRGEELVFGGVAAITTKGAAAFDDWSKFAWPDAIPAGLGGYYKSNL